MYLSRKICKYGAKKPKYRIAIIGNSHAGHWVPSALPILAKQKSWAVDTYIMSSCYTVNAKISIRHNGNSQTPEKCRLASKWATNSVIKGKYDLAIMSNRTATAPLTGVSPKDQVPTAKKLYGKVLKSFEKGGIRTLVVRSVPFLSQNAPTCINANLDNWKVCAAPQSSALEPDPLAMAASSSESPLVTLASPTKSLCHKGLCVAIVGGLFTHFDWSHLTNSFSTSMSPKMHSWINEANARGPRLTIAKSKVIKARLNTNRTVKVRVTNRGRHPARISRINVTGAVFKLLNGGTCKKGRNVSAKRSCLIRVVFRPKSREIKRGRVSTTYKLGGRSVTAETVISGRGSY